MRFLIDGYNLLHALGLARKAGGRAAWDRARDQLLDWLADQHRSSSPQVSVVFDAQKARGTLYEEGHRGLRVLIARGQTADAVIEALVAREPNPAKLTVVSNDREVQHHAERHGCVVKSCQAYVDELLGRAKAIVEAPLDSEKTEEATAAELAEWLKAFGG